MKPWDDIFSADELNNLGVFLSLLDGVLVQLVKLPGVKLGEFRDKYPQVSVPKRKKTHSQYNNETF